MQERGLKCRPTSRDITAIAGSDCYSLEVILIRTNICGKKLNIFIVILVKIA